jgi:N-carbamoyl-L-amino-acid hydrolase
VGALVPGSVLERADVDGVTLAQALQAAGVDPAGMGRDEAGLRHIESFVELHIEQGTLLQEHDRPIGIATSIIPHGRWRIDLSGEANHGGTTAMDARRDPMVVLAEVLQASRRVAEEQDSLVTVGKVDVWPNAPTSIAERVSAWLDVRADHDDTLDRIVAEIGVAVNTIASDQSVGVQIAPESRTGEVRFSDQLSERIGRALATVDIAPVPMSTGAGHDAGVLASELPTAMLFVRNQTGISHSPAELARAEDCVTGIGALVTVLDELRTEGPGESARRDGQVAGRA